MKLLQAQSWAIAAALAGPGLAETIVTLDSVVSVCPPLGAVLPPPKLPSADANVQLAVSQINSMQNYLQENLLDNATALTLAVASVYEDKPLLNQSYNALVYNTTGVHTVDGDTVFRIGSVSKVFTVMGLLLLGENISWADPITKYVPELNSLKTQQDVQNAVTTVDWDVISIDALASQLAGVGYDLGNDLGNNPDLNLTEFGLPPLTSDDVSGCGELPSSRPCSWDDFWNDFGKRDPTYGPYTTPAYSDATYDILSLVIERVSNQSYGDFIQNKIFNPLNMTRSFVTKPEDDSIGFISSESNFWSTSYGFLEADGGFYSTANDLLKYGQGILSNKLLSDVTTRAWLKPRSHTSSLGISVGAPWEIGRANNLTIDGRVIDVYTKNGGLTDYNALFVLVPDYGLVLSMVSGGTASSLQTQLYIASQILENLVRAVEAAGKAEAAAGYAGTYVNEATNSSITIGVDDEAGLNITSWFMNGKDILVTWSDIASKAPETAVAPLVEVRLFPTGLASNDSTGWRAVYDTTPPADASDNDSKLFILQSGCQSWASIDNLVYGLRALDDFEFGLDSCTGNATSITPRAFRQTLTRV